MSRSRFLIAAVNIVFVCDHALQQPLHVVLVVPGGRLWLPRWPYAGFLNACFFAPLALKKGLQLQTQLIDVFATQH